MKGINERHLHESLNSLIKDEIIKNIIDEEEIALEPMIGSAIYEDQMFKRKIIDDVLDI